MQGSEPVTGKMPVPQFLLLKSKHYIAFFCLVRYINDPRKSPLKRGTLIDFFPVPPEKGDFDRFFSGSPVFQGDVDQFFSGSPLFKGG
jgi:hypothetical protein